jgi:hypothetical protein
MKASGFKVQIALIVFLLPFVLAVMNSCSKASPYYSPAQKNPEPNATYGLSLDFTRIDQAGPDPFTVKANLSKEGAAVSGAALELNVPNGSVSAVRDNHDGTYEFTVTPTTTGVYPVTVSYGGVSVRRDALVLAAVGTGVGQPLAVPGTYVNSAGYEDGATITPDGNYLFVQYGPIYFSGILLINSICQSGSYSMYDAKNCGGKSDSNWVFEMIGP